MSGMQFNYTSEQSQLAQSLRRMLSDHHGFRQRQALLREPVDRPDPLWRHFTDMGVTALAVPEVDAGLGGKTEDLFVVLRELGRALVVGHYVSSCVIAPAALLLAASTSQRAPLLAGIAAGELRIALALTDANGDVRPAAQRNPGCTAYMTQGQWTLSGQHSGIAHLPGADWLLIRAGVEGDAREGEALFLVDTRAAGTEVRGHTLVDGSRAGDVRLQGAPAARLGEGAGVPCAAVVSALDRLGAAAACAEALGVMELAYELTREYVNTRQQFGRTLATNQAVRHCIADMRVSLESATSMAMLAAIVIDNPQASVDPNQDIASAKMLIGRLGRQLCEDAIQLHGGVGMTDEFAVGHCLRRMLVLDHSFGNADVQLGRLADSLSMAGTDARVA